MTLNQSANSCCGDVANINKIPPNQRFVTRDRRLKIRDTMGDSYKNCRDYKINWPGDTVTKGAGNPLLSIETFPKSIPKVSIHSMWVMERSSQFTILSDMKTWYPPLMKSSQLRLFKGNDWDQFTRGKWQPVIARDKLRWRKWDIHLCHPEG